MEGFACKSFFKLLLDLSPFGSSMFDIILRIKIPKKVKFFIWQMLLGHVNTFDRLNRGKTTLVFDTPGSFLLHFASKGRRRHVSSFLGLSVYEDDVEFFLAKVWY